MAAAAKINLEFGVRRALMCLVLFGGGLYFLYDGALGYPKQNRLCEQAYQELRQKNMPADLFDSEWGKLLKQRGWSHGSSAAEIREASLQVRPPEKALHTSADIRIQFLMAALYSSLGGLLAFFTLRAGRKRFSADDAGLHGFLPETVPYAAITAVDRKKWDGKGIAYVTVTTAAGARKLTLDDWKFKGMADILAEIDRNRPDLAPPPAPVSEASAEEPPPTEADNMAPPTE